MLHFLDSSEIAIQHAVQQIRCTEVSFKKSGNYPEYEGRNCPQSRIKKEQPEIMTGFHVCLAGIQACQEYSASHESPEFVEEIKTLMLCFKS